MSVLLVHAGHSRLLLALARHGFDGRPGNHLFGLRHHLPGLGTDDLSSRPSGVPMQEDSDESEQGDQDDQTEDQ
jgi:hypothetical protein